MADLEKMTVKELKAALAQRGLPGTGNKAKLLERLTESYESGTGVGLWAKFSSVACHRCGEEFPRDNDLNKDTPPTLGHVKGYGGAGIVSKTIECCLTCYEQSVVEGYELPDKQEWKRWSKVNWLKQRSKEAQTQAKSNKLLFVIVLVLSFGAAAFYDSLKADNSAAGDVANTSAWDPGEKRTDSDCQFELRRAVKWKDDEGSWHAKASYKITNLNTEVPKSCFATLEAWTPGGHSLGSDSDQTRVQPGQTVCAFEDLMNGSATVDDISLTLLVWDQGSTAGDFSCLPSWREFFDFVWAQDVVGEQPLNAERVDSYEDLGGWSGQCE
jgi:hypothetical protein